jgi:CRISPR-associated protein Cas2
MARRHYLITYDISDDKRRTGVFNTLMDNGNHAQYSVFLCELTETELSSLRSVLQPLINNAEDQVLIVDLGLVQDISLTIEALGRIYSAPVRTMIV